MELALNLMMLISACEAISKNRRNSNLRLPKIDQIQSIQCLLIIVLDLCVRRAIAAAVSNERSAPKSVLVVMHFSGYTIIIDIASIVSITRIKVHNRLNNEVEFGLLLGLIYIQKKQEKRRHQFTLSFALEMRTN